MSNTNKEPVFWIGEPPKACNFCNTPIVHEFFDGRTIHGPWAYMCRECFNDCGVGLGTGRGQLFTKQKDGKFMKTEG